MGRAGTSIRLPTQDRAKAFIRNQQHTRELIATLVQATSGKPSSIWYRSSATERG
jgi:hypothetical protein